MKNLHIQRSKKGTPLAADYPFGHGVMKPSYPSQEGRFSAQWGSSISGETR